jgi:hypothetical protein
MCRVCWCFWKAWAQFADNRTTFTHRPVFKMFKKLEKPAACEMLSVIRFLNARNKKSADINRQFCEVYEEHAISDLIVRRWVRHYNDDPRSGRPSLVNEDLCFQWKRRFKKTDNSPIRHFPCIFHKFQGHFFTKWCLMNFVFGNCVHAGCRRCLRMNTKWNKRRGMLSRGVAMLHDNSRPHTAAGTQDLIATFGWEQSDHPLYSPDLAPKWFSCVPAYENFPWWPVVPRRRVQRSR